MDDQDAGRRIAGRYRLIETVGRGGMGIVWRAEDEVLGRSVAVKQVLIPPHLPDQEQEVLRERVLREARAAARLHDPAAVTVFDVVEEGGSPYLVMELVDAASLAEVVRDDGPLAPAEVARIGVAVLGALEAAHGVGIIHRDVKPGNVMVCHNGRVLLTDFGIASTQGDPSITQTGLLLGSPAYIAPERARGEVGGAPSDLWALGATLFTAVEGTPPYDGDGALQTLTAVVEGRRRPTRLAGPLAPVLESMLAEDPSARPTVGQARAMLEEVRRGGRPGGASAATVAVPHPATGAGPAERTQVMQASPLAAPAPGHTVVPAPAYLEETYDEVPGRPARRRGRGLALAVALLLLLGGGAAAVLVATGVLGGSSRQQLGGSGAPSVPAGWVVYRDPTGWTIAHPADWVRRNDVPGGGVAFGKDDTHYVRVTRTAPAVPALATLAAMREKKAGTLAGRPAVDPAAGPLADPSASASAITSGDGTSPTPDPTGAGAGGTAPSPTSEPPPTSAPVASSTPARSSAAAPPRSSAAPPSPRQTTAAATSTASPRPASASASPSRRGGVQGYREIALTATDSGDGSTAADYEWVEASGGGDLHLLDRALVADGALFQVLLVAPDADWAALHDTISSISGSFRSH